MSKRLDTRLSEEDRLVLEQVFRKSQDLRARERAKTLLLLCQPLLSREVSKVQDPNICTVRETWQRWLKEGMACLYDKPRSGAPRKLDEAAVDRLVQWAREEPLTATQLLQRHVETLTRILRANGLVWKRIRHSLKKQDAAAVPKSSQELVKLKRQAQAGGIEVADLDKADFAQVHPNRSAWTPRGEQHLIDAPRGKRLNVMAALLCSGTVEYAHYWCSSTAELFLGFVNDLAQKGDRARQRPHPQRCGNSAST